MQRTIRLKLNTTSQQAQVLRQTLDDFTIAFNYVCEYGWTNFQKNGVKFHHATYYTLKGMVKLPAQLICTARIKASETLRSSFARVKAKRKVSQPRSKLCPARYDQRTYRVNWQSSQVSLATHFGRQLIGFTVPNYALKYTGLEVDSADLLYRKSRFWLHVVVTLPELEYNSNNETIGVDLGLNHPAVTSQRKFLGTRHWKEVDQRTFTFRLRRSLQSKSTKSAKRHLRKLAGRQQRFRRDCDHVLSKRIVQSSTSGTTIVIENLTDIRSKTRMRKNMGKRRLHSWSFAQLRFYKAEEAGQRVVVVDPRYTSQICSRCGFQARSNRKSQSVFLCGECSYQLNADLNASYNIRNKHLASFSTSLVGGSQSIGLSSQTSSEA